jgi:beta-lactamase superfamily II metal-dependent hydrolase
MPRQRKKIIDVASAIILLALITLDAALWKNILTDRATPGSDVSTARIYFLPVTQGESSLLVLPNSVTMLTDAGADAGIVDDLQKALPSGNASYIDLAIISYPQAANYEGYQYLLQHDRIGAFLYNGRSDTAHKSEWQQLMATIAQKHIPLITVGAGDKIRYGGAGEIDILSPDVAFTHSPDPADTGIVERIITPKFTALLAADIGVNVEGTLLARSNTDLRANILKAPFPGLGTTAGDVFLKAVNPRTIVVMPGAKNTPSAPTKAMLAHLASSTTATIATPGHGAFLLYNK